LDSLLTQKTQFVAGLTPRGARRIAYVLLWLAAGFGSSSIEGRASIVRRTCRPITRIV
jgi:hypothetical protein